MINKIVATMAEAMAGIKDGSTILLGGFGAVGQPNQLIDGLIETGAKDLVMVANNAGTGRKGLARLMELGALDPECIVTAGIFVDRVLHVPYGDPPV